MFNKNIPDYAKYFKNEYLFIIGINKKCERFVKKIDEENVFNTSQAKKLILCFNKFLIFQKLEYFKDISEFYFKEEDVKFIGYLECKKIKNKQGELTYNNPESANFWSVHLLWPKKDLKE